ncbi:DEAD/DEAH box helicase [Desulfuribacillus alkaliarsenatis]|uniref:RNA helicase n=1 Tax=Desulfuribacillus alkaliarsenatis TaxID=766136 RepID=A0A1E5G445_9FIRM|nr:DEAD/DEAH box helicase [Desulfuribacillus alkaliarsenatis]OEF97439.1 RNA helicase [Desulfuribacillus alkaliarsenatis]
MKDFIVKLWEESGFQDQTEIQKQAMPVLLAGKDVIAESPTGTGKTLAYLLPVIEKVDPDKKNIQAVILAPSHELAMQIYHETQKWTKGSNINSAALIGGANIKKQVEVLKKLPQIVVGTTGRVLELIKLKKMKMHEVKTIVVDEFDVLIAQEHVGNLNNIVKTTLKDRQIALFSATLSKRTEDIASELMNEPQLIQVKRSTTQGPSNTDHLYAVCEHRDKVNVLMKLVRSGIEKALVFINDFEKIKEIESKLTFKDFKIGVISGNSNKIERKNVINDFRNGKLNLVVASDVAARGLDIEALSHVINFDMTRDVDSYTHRAGRTGRMGAKGTVISLVTKGEEALLKRIAKKLNVTAQEVELHHGKCIIKK